MPDLNADIDGYLQAAGLNATPPPLAPDPLAAGTSPADQLLWTLGLAANAADPADAAAGIEQHAQREAALGEAAEKFLAQDEAARAEVAGVGGAEQLPQLAAGLAGALSGALGAALQPLTQLPQQLIQGAQQAVSTGIGLVTQMAGADVTGRLPADLGGDFGDSYGDLTDGDFSDFGGDFSDFGVDFGGSDSGGGFGFGDIPGTGGPGGLDAVSGPGFGAGGAAVPVPLPAPPAALPSPATTLSAGTGQPATPAAAATPAPVGSGGMAGFPMVPPAGLAGAAGDKDAKADTKRVSVPSVRNGAAVTGRLIPPPAVAVVTRSVDATPVATRLGGAVPPAG